MFEESGYDFSNIAKLGEHRDEVIGEKIHRLLWSRMKLKKQRYHVSTPRFGLRFSLPKPLPISSMKGKEIASSHQISIEKTKESKKNKTPRQTSVFYHFGRLTTLVYALKLCGLLVSAFEFSINGQFLFYVSPINGVIILWRWGNFSPTHIPPFNILHTNSEVAQFLIIQPMHQ